MESITNPTNPTETTEPTEQKVTFKYINEDGQEKEKIFETDENGYVDFGDVSRALLGQQSQYVSRYVDGILEGYPKLGEGLHVEGNSEDYHSMKIHKDDVTEFVGRYKDYRKM